MILKRKGRILAMESFYRYDLLKEDPEEALQDILKHRNAERESKEFARELVKKIKQGLATIDTLLKQHLQNWDLNRLTPLDRTLLRVGTAELLYYPDVPARVVISEILRISHIYSQDESHRILNGVLDIIAKEVRKEN